MRSRALFLGMVLALALAGPAQAKALIGTVDISGPGLGGGSGTGGGWMHIDAPAADGMWESGVLDDRKEDSVSALGLSPSELGPRYLVTIRFDFGPGSNAQLVRQVLYPYAKGGPVTFTPPGQEQTGEEDLTGMGMSMPIPAGWFRTNSGFFQYLVEHGFPATTPLAAPAKTAPRNEPAAQTAPASQSAPWAWVLIGLAGLAALALATPAVRRRVLVLVTRVNY